MTVRDEAAEPGALARRFPPAFAFGAATAAYQVEGSVNADGRGPSIWDTFSHTQGRTLNGDTGDVACDHYRRWASDLDLIAGLGLRAYRFSIAWPRIQPTGSGPANLAGLDFYDRLVDGLLARGVEPWATLYHWDLPQAVEDQGGWTTRDTIARFGDYAAIVARRLGDRLPRLITINEPRTHALIGHGTGRHAPGRTGWATALRVAHHLHLAHNAAARAVRAEAPAIRVGISHDVADLVPAGDGRDDAAAMARHDAAMRDWFVGPTFGRGYPSDLLAWYDAHGFVDGIDPAEARLAEPIDFLGVNYYRRERIAAAPVTDGWGIGSRVVDHVGEHAGNGWEISPGGLRAVLGRLHADYAPAELAITENGATFDEPAVIDGMIDDAARRSYLARHLAAAADAIEDGVPLVGYFAWSLLDNFEWALGYGTRFGLVHVDYETQAREPKASAHWYRSLLEAHR